MKVPTPAPGPVTASDARVIALALDRAAAAPPPDPPCAAELARMTAFRSTASRLASRRIVVLGSQGASRMDPDGTVALALADVVTLLGALRDAADWRRYRAEAWCAECAAAVDHMCPSHVRDLDLADTYAALSRALGDDR